MISTHTNMTRLIQIKKGNERRVALVEEPRLRFLRMFLRSTPWPTLAISAGVKLSEAAQQRIRRIIWIMTPSIRQLRLEVLPAIDHPDEPARCLVSGTGLTHLGSARDRQKMHASTSNQKPTA